MSSPLGDELHLHLEDGSSVVANRLNTVLFTFWGANAVYNHVYINTGDVDLEGEDSDNDEAICEGQYVFNEDSLYQGLHDHIKRNDWPQVLNTNYVPACDQQAHTDMRLEAMAAQLDPTMFDGFGD